MTDNWASDIRARTAAHRTEEEKRRLGLVNDDPIACSHTEAMCCTAWIGSLRVPFIGVDKCVMPLFYEGFSPPLPPGFHSYFDWIRGSVT